MSNNTQEITNRVKEHAPWVEGLQREVARVVVGQRYLIDGLLIGMLTNGHVLLEGVPGLAKTLTVKTLSSAIRTGFSRIQFTPDLLPADLIGTLIYNPREGVFTTKKGPIFSNLILADEINRAPAKVQSALLEAMQERQVTLGGETHKLPSPFLVLATENPIDQEGTYPLPEAQVDRFMLKVVVGYPTFEEERKILDTMAFTQPKTEVEKVIEQAEIVAARAVVDALHVDEKVRDYIVHIVFATREPAKYGVGDLAPLIQFGASPRATISLTLAAKAWAFIQGRAYVTPGDIKAIGADVLRHRVLLTYEAEAQGITSDAVVKRIFDNVPVP